MSNKRVDVYASFHGDDLLQFSHPDKITARNFVEKHFREKLDTCWRNRQGGQGRLSVHVGGCGSHRNQVENAKALLQTRGGGVFVFIFTRSCSHHPDCRAELERALQLHDESGIQQKPEHMNVLICFFDKDRDNLEGLEELWKRNVSLIGIEECQAGVEAYKIAEKVVKTLIDTHRVAGDTREESFANLKELVATKVSAGDLANRLLIKGRFHNSMSVLGSAEDKGVISAGNVDRLLRVNERDAEMFTKSYRGKWLLEWTGDDWSSALQAVLNVAPRGAGQEAPTAPTAPGQNSRPMQPTSFDNNARTAVNFAPNFHVGGNYTGPINFHVGDEFRNGK